MKNPINTEPDGSCKTIKAQYYKNGVANFIRGGQLRHGTFLDCYNQTISKDVSGTILTGISFRCMHYVSVFIENTPSNETWVD